MPLYQASVKTASATVDEIADCVGASADTEMRTRAFRSLSAAIKHWNGRAKWAWLLTEGAPITVVAPFTSTATASGGSAHLTANSGHGVLVDDWIAGYGFASGVRVSAVTSTGIYLNASATGFTGTAASGYTANRDFYDLPSDWKAAYSVRLLNGNRYLKPANRRIYDRMVTNEFQIGVPEAYDIFQVAAKGKVRLLPSPSDAGTVMLRYFRRIGVPSSSTATATLDVPQDYDDYLTAYGKWHFLTDKDQARHGQAQTWLSVAQDGIKTMMKDEIDQPDEDLSFSPGHTNPWPSTSSTRFVDVGEYS